MSDSLYAAIGGEETIHSVVRDFYQMVCYDEQLQGYFEETDLDSLRAHQQEFLSSVTGGPVTYSGDDMRQAHSELSITESDFELVSTYLQRALEQNGVEETHRTAVLEAVDGYKDAVLDR